MRGASSTPALAKQRNIAACGVTIHTGKVTIVEAEIRNHAGDRIAKCWFRSALTYRPEGRPQTFMENLKPQSSGI